MTRRRGIPRQVLVSPLPALAVLVMALVAASCSSGSTPKPVAVPTTIAATTSTTSLAEAQAVILTAWRTALDANEAAAKDPTGGAVLLLSDYFVDPELSFLRTQYAVRDQEGFVDIGTLDLGQPRVESMTSTQAVVVSCETNALQMISAATRKPVSGLAGSATPTSFGVKTTLTVAPDGTWKVSDSVGAEGSCAGL